MQKLTLQELHAAARKVGLVESFDGRTMRIVAVLHDVVEDGAMTLANLRKEGFSHEVIDGLDSVTRRPGEEYTAFVARAAADPIGRWVKYEDLRDNADLARISEPTEADLARTAKYHRAMAQLEAA